MTSKTDAVGVPVKLWFGTGDDIQTTHAEARAVEDRIELSKARRSPGERNA